MTLLERFYREVYLPEFAARREPLEAWQRALAGDAPYRLAVRVEVDGDTRARRAPHGAARRDRARLRRGAVRGHGTDAADREVAELLAAIPETVALVTW